ncbi:MAG TPA: mechanosensitive ion channel protein MscS, partial [Leeuwenhoekiella sp.]|nr:mechanosensitive ion channel protein MscS [Leeuwenhoekiella sp.]
MAYQIDTYLKDFSSYIESAGVTSFYAEMLTVFINAFIFILLLAFLDKLLKKIIV